MAFYGSDFMFDGKPSRLYGLFLANFDSSMIKSPAGSDIEAFKRYTYRRARPYLYGVSPTPVLEFPITIVSHQYIDATTRSLIEAWLFGHKGYKKFQPIQSDLSNVYYNCLLKNPKSVFVGNLQMGIECTVEADAPWGWLTEKTTTKTFAGSSLVNDTFSFYNSSADNDYLYPELIITTNVSGCNISITNNTDSGRVFSFSDVAANEVLTVDNDRQIISSSTGLTNRLGKFNKKWFRLLPGNNNITVAGGISSIDIVHQFAKKVGG